MPPASLFFARHEAKRGNCHSGIRAHSFLIRIYKVLIYLDKS